jgi:hypothetical protein
MDRRLNINPSFVRGHHAAVVERNEVTARHLNDINR